jgi:hypothetical protein
MRWLRACPPACLSSHKKWRARSFREHGGDSSGIGTVMKKVGLAKGRLLPFVPGQTREEKLAKFQLLFPSMAGMLTAARVKFSPQEREHGGDGGEEVLYKKLH